jgi:hypothetical protein
MFHIWTSNSFLLLKNVIIYIKIIVRMKKNRKKIMAPFSLLRRTTVSCEFRLSASDLNHFAREETVQKLILNHQEVVGVKNYNIAPQHRSSKNESIQTIIFIQPGLSRNPFPCRITSQFNLNCFAKY